MYGATDRIEGNGNGTTVVVLGRLPCVVNDGLMVLRKVSLSIAPGLEGTNLIRAVREVHPDHIKTSCNELSTMDDRRVNANIPFLNMVIFSAELVLGPRDNLSTQRVLFFPASCLYAPMVQMMLVLR